MQTLMSFAERQIYDRMTRKEKQAYRDSKRDYGAERSYLKRSIENIAILDFETEPFDNTKPELKIVPFLAVLWTSQFAPIVMWDNDFEGLCKRVVAAIEGLPDRWTVYAHNGGKFDYMFFLHELRGRITFKGRGLMKAQLGRHELRDSLHILPVKLSAFQKDEFDYEKMKAARRDEHRDEIIRYCINDCAYLHKNVYAFVKQFGFKLTIGQAALTELKKVYTFDRYGEGMDAHLRNYYHGGRVECLQGAGRWTGDYKLYDVNSMYPAGMVYYKHPHLSREVDYRYSEPPSANTFFIRLRCKNDGALVTRPSVLKVFDTGDATLESPDRGEFFTTIHEYNVAMKHKLISDVEFIECIDFAHSTDFADFILPMYAQRQVHLAWLDANYGRAFSAEWDYHNQQSIFLKLLMNNAYGKFAQNPENFMDRYITGPKEFPPSYEKFDAWGSDEFMRDGRHVFTVWERPALNKRFNNVAVAASITGACRSMLLDAVQNSDDAIYCDTDSILCRSLNNVELSNTKLGAWKLEAEFDEVLICGKKAYACRNSVTGKQKLRWKGGSGLKWQDYSDMLDGKTIKNVATGITLYKSGAQQYLNRNMRVTTRRRRAA